MATFIEFTNGAEEYDGKKISINVDNIGSIFRDEQQVPAGTVLYSVNTQNVWTVKESYEEVLKLIHKSS